MSSTPPSDRFPGWYADPLVAALERFWDGRVWTDRTRVALTLDDYLGPIEPVLAALLATGDSQTTDAAGDPSTSRHGASRQSTPRQSTSRE